MNYEYQSYGIPIDILDKDQESQSMMEHLDRLRYDQQAVFLDGNFQFMSVEGRRPIEAEFTVE